MSDNPIFSRCSLGRHRWFWIVHRCWEAVFQGEAPSATGYAFTAQEAEKAALAFAPTAEKESANMAKHYHRDLCQQRRAASPCSGSKTAATQEFLYRDWLGDCDTEYESIPHLIVKRTKKLVFVETDDYHPDPWDRRTFALNRAELDATGSTWSHQARNRFHTTPWEQRRPSWASPELTLLGVKTGASKQEIKAAYRRLARQHHPDCGGDPEMFKQIQQAYERAMAG